MADRRYWTDEARRFRTCPPHGAPPDPSERTLWRRHLDICPECAAASSESQAPDAAWTEFADALRRTVPPGLFPDPPPLSPGQFRPLRADLARWIGDRYFSPPLVLVLDIPETPDMVRVAPTYSEPGLAGPGDLILGNERTRRGALFVETWNLFRVSAGTLSLAAGAVDAETLDAVRAMAREPSALPPWAPRPRPLKPEDPRREFRALEREVAEIFAAPVLVPHAGASLLRLAHDTARAVREALIAAAPRIRWIDMAPGLEGLLAAATPEPVPLAAADPESPISRANLVILREGRIADFRAVPMETAEPARMGPTLGISGRVLDLPATGRAAGLLAFLKRPDHCRRPATVHWNGADGRFYLEFPDPPHPPGELALAVLWEDAP
jgi:hypothetical protein